jgi:O-antigen ligase
VLTVVVVLLQSRTALVTLVVAAAAFTTLVARRLPARRHVALAALGGAVTVLAVDACLGFSLVHKVTHDWQGSGRLALWATALSMFHSAPALGHGPSSYALHYRSTVDALGLPPWIAADRGVTPWPHNLYLELLAEQGVVGLLAFVALGAVAFALLVRVIRSPHTDIHLLGAGAGASLIAFLAAAVFELSFLRVWVTIVLFTVLGLLTALSRTEKRATAC